MAKKDKPSIPTAADREAAHAQSMEQMQTGGMVKWKAVAQIAVAFVVLWVLAVMAIPYISYWGLGVAGVLTLAAVGLALYLWRMSRKQNQLVSILKGATDADGRKEALEKLRAADGKGSDALNKLAQAQILAQESPAEAMAMLETIDIKKAPIPVQDDIRANLGMMYLLNGKAQEARELADDIKLTRQTQPKAQAMYAAVMAESFARTGKVAEARELIDAYDASKPEYGEASAMLYRAQVYTFTKEKKRGRAMTAMQSLAAVDPNMASSFLMVKGNPQLTKMARDALGAAGVIPKQKVRMRMK